MREVCFSHHVHDRHRQFTFLVIARSLWLSDHPQSLKRCPWSKEYKVPGTWYTGTLHTGLCVLCRVYTFEQEWSPSMSIVFSPQSMLAPATYIGSFIISYTYALTTECRYRYRYEAIAHKGNNSKNDENHRTTLTRGNTDNSIPFKCP